MEIERKILTRIEKKLDFIAKKLDIDLQEIENGIARTEIDVSNLPNKRLVLAAGIPLTKVKEPKKKKKAGKLLKFPVKKKKRLL